MAITRVSTHGPSYSLGTELLSSWSLQLGADVSECLVVILVTTGLGQADLALTDEQGNDYVFFINSQEVPDMNAENRISVWVGKPERPLAAGERLTVTFRNSDQARGAMMFAVEYTGIDGVNQFWGHTVNSWREGPVPLAVDGLPEEVMLGVPIAAQPASSITITAGDATVLASAQNGLALPADALSCVSMFILEKQLKAGEPTDNLKFEVDPSGAGLTTYWVSFGLDGPTSIAKQRYPAQGRSLMGATNRFRQKLTFERYTDAVGEAPGQITLVDRMYAWSVFPDWGASRVAAGGQGFTRCGQCARKSGVVDLLYLLEDEPQLRTSRDQGTTWTGQTLVTPRGSSFNYERRYYTEMSPALDPVSGNLVVALAFGTSRIVVGQLDQAGADWSFRDTRPLEIGEALIGDLTRESDGSWYLSCVRDETVPRVVHVMRCRSLGSDGRGTWLDLGVVAIGYNGVDGATRVAHHLNARTGQLAVALYDARWRWWRLVVGTQSDSGSGWNWSGQQPLVDYANGCGCLRTRADGIWEFHYVTDGSRARIVQCRSLRNDATGTWE